MNNSFDKDPIGHAINDYSQGIAEMDVVVRADLCEDDVLPLDWLFRSFDEMPVREQKALNLCRGAILDVGSGAGCHSLYLTKKGGNITSIDTSFNCIQYQLNQGINAKNIDFFELTDLKFDTLLFLMNGLGICGTLERLPILLKHAYSLLNNGGQVLCDSTDITYLYQEEDGSQWMDLNSEYFGNFKFQMQYKETVGDWFDWLYVDADKLTEIAEEIGFSVEIELGEEGQYFAKLVKE